MKQLLVAVLVAACSLSPARAADSGLFVAGDFGLATYSGVEPAPSPGKFGLGAGYKFFRYLGVETGLTTFGKSTVQSGGFSAELKARSFFVAALGLVPITPQWNVFGKLGVTRNHAEASNSLGASLSVTRNSPYYAVGTEYALNAEWSVRAQYEGFGKFENGPGRMKASAASIGIAYYLN